MIVRIRLELVESLSRAGGKCVQHTSNRILIKTNPHEPLFEPDNFKSLTTAFATSLFNESSTSKFILKCTHCLIQKCGDHKLSFAEI